MKRLFFSLFCLSCIWAAASAQPKLGKDNISAVVKAMTPEEKAKLVVGIQLGSDTWKGRFPAGTGGVTYPFEKYGIPHVVMMDGPVGIRLDDHFTTCFPTGLLTAASWDKSVARSIGEAIGEESLAMGNDVILAPGMNILRNPLNGRNFEYFSEDPVLSGLIAAAYVNGVQSKGVGTSAKHFAANNQETNRLDGDSRLDTRTLREIYTKAFELCVRDSQPWTVMASYNYLNGEYTQESHDLLDAILRKEFGFKGLVVTDWTSKRNTPKQIHAGSDLLMGGNPSQTEHILESLGNGSLKMEDLDRAVTKVLELVVKSPAFNGNKATYKPDLEGDARIARELAGEGMVLLKNDGVLPVKAAKTAVFGVHSYDLIRGGNGAAWVHSPHVVSVADGLGNAGFEPDPDLCRLYKAYASFIAEDLRNNHKVNVHVGDAQKPELEITRKAIENSAKNNDLAVITLGRISGEARDRILGKDFLLQENEINLVENVCEVYHAAGKKVVVILNICGPVETASWNYLPDAILCAWLPGQEGGDAIADVLDGKVNPSGRLPMTFPLDYFDAAGAEDFPYDFRSDSANESVVHPERRGLPLKNVAYTDYTEGIYVGYRYFCTEDKPVSYPFGYGLSYTTFSYSAANAKVKGDKLLASVTVTNTGTVAGKEAVGLYVSAPLGSFKDKPSRELREFGKTRLLQPGESQTLNFTVPVRQLASFNSGKSRWETAKGSYKAYFGADVTRPQAEAAFKVMSAKNYPVSRACEPTLKELSVLTYNVGAFGKYSEDSSDAVAELIKASGASLVGLNELDSCNRRHNVFQLERLAEKLGGWNHVFASAFPFAGGAYGNGILSRKPILRSWRIALPRFEGSEERSVAVVETEDCVFASTHLDFQDEESTLSQVRIINDWFSEHFSGYGKPVLLSGDMNSRPGSKVMKELQKKWTIIHRTEKSYPSQKPDACIDYILTLNGAVEVSGIDGGTIQTVATRTASDHLPVFAKIRY